MRLGSFDLHEEHAEMSRHLLGFFSSVRSARTVCVDLAR